MLDVQEFHGFQEIRLGAAKLRAKRTVSARMCASSLQLNRFRAGCAEAPREIDNFGRGWRAGLPWLPRLGTSISHAENFRKNHMIFGRRICGRRIWSLPNVAGSTGGHSRRAAAALRDAADRHEAGAG